MKLEELFKLTEEELASLSIPYKRHRGIYLIFKEENLLYIGLTTDWAQRLCSHERKYKGVSSVFVEVPDNIDLEAVESLLIDRFKPPMNKNEGGTGAGLCSGELAVKLDRLTAQGIALDYTIPAKSFEAIINSYLKVG